MATLPGPVRLGGGSGSSHRPAQARGCGLTGVTIDLAGGAGIRVVCAHRKGLRGGRARTRKLNPRRPSQDLTGPPFCIDQLCYAFITLVNSDLAESELRLLI